MRNITLDYAMIGDEAYRKITLKPQNGTERRQSREIWTPNLISAYATTRDRA